VNCASIKAGGLPHPGAAAGSAARVAIAAASASTSCGGTRRRSRRGASPRGTRGHRRRLAAGRKRPLEQCLGSLRHRSTATRAIAARRHTARHIGDRAEHSIPGSAVSNTAFPRQRIGIVGIGGTGEEQLDVQTAGRKRRIAAAASAPLAAQHARYERHLTMPRPARKGPKWWMSTPDP